VTSTLTRIQLYVFALVTVLSVSYGGIRLFHVGSVVSPPYEISAQFASAGGIYQRADVELLGTRVGSVREVRPGPGSGTTVVMAINHGVKIPADVIAAIGNKSAIGEQYVGLTPKSSGGDTLGDGDVIELSRTRSPVQVAKLLGDLDGLAGSVPRNDLTTVLREVSTAVSGLGPTMGHMIDDSDTLTRASLENVDDLTALIDDASTVLDTQVAKGPQTTAYLRDLALLTQQLRRMDPAFDDLFVQGIRAGTEVTNLLSDNQQALPVLLNNLVSLTKVAADRKAAVRKTLVIFPWVLEEAATVIRPCDEYDPHTGKPIQSTCHYDAQGKPIFSAHLGLQLPEMPGSAPYLPCTKGYEGTQRYLPNGERLDGGPREQPGSQPNMDAGCAASVNDPVSPNVRGAQNIPSGESGAGRTAPGWGMALYDPNNGTVAAPDGQVYRLSGLSGPPPPSGDAGLAWLLTGPMSEGEAAW